MTRTINFDDIEKPPVEDAGWHVTERGASTQADRRPIMLQMRRSDLRHAARSLDARADGLLSRRDRDPILRAAATKEAGSCRRFAVLLNEAAKGSAG